MSAKTRLSFSAAKGIKTRSFRDALLRQFQRKIDPAKPMAENHHSGGTEPAARVSALIFLFFRRTIKEMIQSLRRPAPTSAIDELCASSARAPMCASWRPAVKTSGATRFPHGTHCLYKYLLDHFQDEGAHLIADTLLKDRIIPREAEILSEENLSELRRGLAHLSLPAVRDFTSRRTAIAALFPTVFPVLAKCKLWVRYGGSCGRAVIRSGQRSIIRMGEGTEGPAG